MKRLGFTMLNNNNIFLRKLHFVRYILTPNPTTSATSTTSAVIIKIRKTQFQNLFKQCVDYTEFNKYFTYKFRRNNFYH